MPEPVEIRAQVDRIAESEGFRSSPLLSRFLRYTVEQSLTGNLDALKETVIGVEVCGRTKFDPRYDSVVRTTASRLRTKLTEFYATNPGEPIRIEYPRGGYVPQFLEAAATESEELREPSPIHPPPPARRSVPTAVFAGLALFAVAAGVLWWYSRPRTGFESADAVTRRFQLAIPSHLRAGPLINTGPSRVSPDGRMFAIALREVSSDYAIWIHHFASGEWKQISPPGIRVTHPFWSPDSTELAGVTPRELWRIRVDGSNPQMITEVIGLGSAAWSSKGQILFTTRGELGLQMVPASGGKPTQITRLAKPDESWHAWPVFLPGGEEFFYTALTSDLSKSTVYLATLSNPGERKAILQAASAVSYYPAHGDKGGFIVYQGSRSLMGIRYDAARREVDGQPVAIAPPVSMDVLRGAADMSVAQDGALVTRHGEAQRMRKLLLLDENGKVLQSSEKEELYRFPSFSPDGESIATGIIDLASGIENIWIFDKTLRNPRKYSSGSQSYTSPAWSPDGKRIAFIRGVDVCVADTSGMQQVEQLTSSPQPKVTSSWTPDGKYILYTQYQPDGTQDIMRIEARAGAKSEIVLATADSETEAHISPDGRFLAYESEKAGIRHVFVEHYPVDPNHRDPMQLSETASYSPRWIRGGSELAFVTYSNRRLVTVPIPSRATRTLYETPVWFHRGYGIDCRRNLPQCIVSAPGAEPEAFTLHIVLNPPWPGHARR